MTTALLPALDAFLESARETQRMRILDPIERRLERGIMKAFRDQEDRFLRGFARMKHQWPEPVLREAISQADLDALWAAVTRATDRGFQSPLLDAMKKALVAGNDAAIADLGISISFDLKNPDAVAYLDQAPLKIAGINDTTREEIRRILQNGVEQGLSYDKTAAALKEKFMSFRVPQPQRHIRSRAHLIAITETGDAYAEGNLIVGRRLENAGLKIEKLWHDVQDDKEDEVCLANGAQGWISFDEPFSSGHMAPTAHPACVTGETLVHASGATAVTKRWFDGDLIIIRTASGKNLSCTPNHPILTRSGWVAAELLHEGRYVVGYRGAIRDSSFVDCDGENMPTAIHEVAETFRCSLQVTTREVPTTAIDFHGDGMDGQIAVIWANGLLGNRKQSTFIKRGHYTSLQLRDMIQGSLTSESGLTLGFKGLSPAETSDMSSPGVALVLPGRTVSHHQGIGVLNAPPFDSFGNEAPADRISIDTELFREGIFGLPGEIFLDQIVAVDRYPFSGHVFNLEMPNGWYVANGILTHNCRCDLETRAVV